MTFEIIANILPLILISSALYFVIRKDKSKRYALTLPKVDYATRRGKLNAFALIISIFVAFAIMYFINRSVNGGTYAASSVIRSVIIVVLVFLVKLYKQKHKK
jgi:amino acid transporter